MRRHPSTNIDLMTLNGVARQIRYGPLCPQSMRKYEVLQHSENKQKYRTSCNKLEADSDYGVR